MKSLKDPPSTPSSAASGGLLFAAAPEAPINILIVDDEPNNLTVLETVLDDPGYRLVRANSADEALLALVAEEFALLILDIRLPGMTGIELAQMIRQRKKTSLVPIIFLTAYYNEDQHVLEGYAAGAVDYLQKPINRNILRTKVATFADLHRANRALVSQIAERQRAQEQLHEINETLEQRVIEQIDHVRATEAQFKAMIDALPAAVYATDAEGYLTHYNPATVELSGRLPELGVDRWCTTWKLFRPDGSPLPHDQCPMAVAVKEGHIVRGQQIIVERPDGERLWVMPYPTPIRDAAGNITGAINMLVDITDAKKAEAQVNDAREIAEKANMAKSDFLANMSHEIRTPMNAIFGFTQLLSDTIQTPVERDWILSIQKSGQVLLNLINDVLDLSKIEAGKLELHVQPTHVAGLVDDTIMMFGPQAGGKNIALVREMDDSLAIPLMLDGQRLRQVLMNLVSNAVKYTERGSVTIRLDVSETGNPHTRHLTLQIADTGVGIHPEHLKQIFEPFQQAESPDGKTRPGTGLGLSISLKLVQAMRGHIEVESKCDKGSTFTVNLYDVPVTDQSPAIAQLDEKIDFNLIDPLNILVVDDVLWNAQVAMGYLRNSHHRIHMVTDGLQAVEMAKTLEPDVILMDLRMPNMSGYEARDAIRANPSLAKTAIVAVTASSLRSEEMQLRKTFDGYIRKPYSPTQLSNVLRGIKNPAAIPVQTSRQDTDLPKLWQPDMQTKWHQLQQVDLPVLRSTMRMREIGEFAVHLQEFAALTQSSGLESQAEALRISVKNFDIPKTTEILSELSTWPHEFDLS